jgi:hypothetical protein
VTDQQALHLDYGSHGPSLIVFGMHHASRKKRQHPMMPHFVAYTMTTLWLVMPGCSSATQKAQQSAEPAPKPLHGRLTADLAKAALLELIQAHPEAFEGNPDPRILAQLPIEPLGGGEYGFGAFRVNVPDHHYGAEIGGDAPHSIRYSGSFVERDGKWLALPPEQTHMWKLPVNPDQAPAQPTPLKP